MKEIQKSKDFIYDVPNRKIIMKIVPERCIIGIKLSEKVKENEVRGYFKSISSEDKIIGTETIDGSFLVHFNNSTITSEIYSKLENLKNTQVN